MEGSARLRAPLVLLAEGYEVLPAARAGVRANALGRVGLARGREAAAEASGARRRREDAYEVITKKVQT